MGYESMEVWLAMRQTKYARTLSYMRDVLEDSRGGLNNAIKTSLDTVCKAVHSEAGTFWFYSRFGDGKIYPRAVYGGDPMTGITLKPGQGIAGQVIETGKTELISDCQKDSRWSNKVDEKTGFVTKTMLCVPLLDGGVAFGCLQLINKTDGSLFDDEDKDLVEALAEEISEIFISQHLLSDGKIENYTAVMCINIRGFSKISEKLDPLQIADLINRYLEFVTGPITANGGIISKYVGDSVLAYWIGDAYDVNAAMIASKAALDLIGSSDKFKEDIAGHFDETIDFGIGIDYGPTFVGSVNIAGMLDSSIFGKTVTTAIYLEHNAPAKTVYVSSRVVDALGRKAKATRISPLKLRNTKVDVRVFSLEKIYE